jgi:hypothetical protein
MEGWRDGGMDGGMEGWMNELSGRLTRSHKKLTRLSSSASTHGERLSISHTHTHTHTLTTLRSTESALEKAG